MTHAPTPWMVDPSRQFTGCNIRDARGHTVAIVFPDTPGSPEYDNARLIAAAPELLDLLALALPYVETSETDPGYKRGAVAKMSTRVRALINRVDK